MATLYESIGGQKAIEELVTAFYLRVLGDPLLEPFFAETSMQKLEKMQIAFFTIALGGPEPEMEVSLDDAHRGRGIKVAHLTRYTEHLLATLMDIGVKEEDAQKIYARISSYSNEILGETSVDG